MSEVRERSSHRPVLQLLLTEFSIHTVLEFGAGPYSTPFFDKHGCAVTSIEANLDWFNKMRRQLPATAKLIHMKSRTEDYFLRPAAAGTWDMIFVDGELESRTPCVQRALEHTQIVVFHDSERAVFGYDTVVIPEGFMRVDFRKRKPWTSVITNRMDVLELLQTQLGCVLWST